MFFQAADTASGLTKAVSFNIRTGNVTIPPNMTVGSNTQNEAVSFRPIPGGMIVVHARTSLDTSTALWDGYASSVPTPLPNGLGAGDSDGFSLAPGKAMIQADGSGFSSMVIVDTTGVQGTAAPVLTVLPEVQGGSPVSIRYVEPFDYASVGAGVGFFAMESPGAVPIAWTGDVAAGPIRYDSQGDAGQAILPVPLMHPSTSAQSAAGSGPAVAVALIRSMHAPIGRSLQLVLAYPPYSSGTPSPLAPLHANNNTRGSFPEIFDMSNGWGCIVRRT